MFLTPRQLRRLTGVSGDDPEGQLRFLNERGIRNFGVNRAGLVIVPCSAVEGTQAKPEPAPWQPDFSRV